MLVKSGSVSRYLGKLLKVPMLTNAYAGGQDWDEPLHEFWRGVCSQ